MVVGYHHFWKHPSGRLENPPHPNNSRAEPAQIWNYIDEKKLPALSSEKRRRTFFWWWQTRPSKWAPTVPVISIGLNSSTKKGWNNPYVANLQGHLLGLWTPFIASICPFCSVFVVVCFSISGIPWYVRWILKIYGIFQHDASYLVVIFC